MNADVRTPRDVDPNGDLQRIFEALWQRIYEAERRIEMLEYGQQAARAKVINGKRIA